MAHYAFLIDNIVTHVIVGNQENYKGIDWEEYYANFVGQTCKRTSYNTIENQHLNGGVAFRGNYAGIDYTYDETNDVFIPPKPFESWILDENIWNWKPPVDYPNDDKDYIWNETEQSWDLKDE